MLCRRVALTALAWSLLAWPALGLSEPLTVTIVQSERGGAYDEFTAALRLNLPATSINLTVQDSSQPLPTRPTGLFIAVGMKAARQLAASDAPAILNILIPRSGHRRLLHEYPKRDRGTRYSTIFMDQPVERQLALLALTFPERRRIGVMYEAADDEIELLRQKAPDYGLKLYERQVSDPGFLVDALHDVLQHSDIVLAQPASTLYNSNTLRNVLLSTYRAGIPLVGISASYVRAGAVAAIFSTPAQFAAQASTAVQKFAETGSLSPPQYARQFEVDTNERVAQALSLALPPADEILKRIAQRKERAP